MVISDSGPLIHLASAGTFWLLRRTFGEVVVTRDVYDEVLTNPLDGAEETLQALEDGWIRIAEAMSESEIRRYRSVEPELSVADASTLALAASVAAVLVITDDQTVGRMARREGIQTVGSVGILIEAKKHGLIDAVRPYLSEMERTLWISNAFRNAVLTLADEI